MGFVASSSGQMDDVTHGLPAPELQYNVFDRNGRLLAYSVDAYTIGADPGQSITLVAFTTWRCSPISPRVTSPAD